MHVQLEKLKKIHQFIHCEKNIKEEKDKKNRHAIRQT